MNHERCEHLKDAYVLDALPREDQDTLERYLASHSERQAEVEEVGEGANLLAYSPQQQEPPPELRRRVMEAVEAEAAPRRDRRMSVFAGMREYLARRTFAPGAAAVLVIGLLSWKVLLQEHLPGPDGPSRRGPDRASRPAGPGGSNHSSSRSVGSAGSQCGGVTSIDENRVNLVVEDMRSVPENQTCQIWVIHDDVPTPSGLFDPGGNMTAAAVTTSIEKADAIAVTVEPAGSSEKPTGEPVLLTKL